MEKRRGYSPEAAAGAECWQVGPVTQGAHMERHAGEAGQTAEEGWQNRGRSNEREMAHEGKLSHTYDVMETSGWNNRCSEGHGLRHAGGLHVTKGPYAAQDKADD